jgi:hypothetical protein
VGERWAPLVVRELPLEGSKRFTELLASVPQASPNVLAQHLRKLDRAGVVRRRKSPAHAYQWGPCSYSRQVVAKAEWHQGELFPRVGFILTNLLIRAEGVVNFYHGRSMAEQWITEGKYTLNWTRLSCHRFVANQALGWSCLCWRQSRQLSAAPGPA